MQRMRPTLYSHDEMVLELLRDRDSDEPLDRLYTEIAILASTVSYAGEEAHCAAQELSESFEEDL